MPASKILQGAVILAGSAVIVGAYMAGEALIDHPTGHYIGTAVGLAVVLVVGWVFRGVLERAWED